jgi:hypothetical protein
MRCVTAFLAALVLGAASPVPKDYSIIHKGIWPNSWPKELDPLRSQARTLEGPLLPQLTYEVPFTRREDFESAWPHLLKVKSQGAPIILVRGPYKFLGANMKAGVVVHCPPVNTDRKANPESPLPGQRRVRSTWMWTNFIELVVDGDVVDLKRITFPADTPIVADRA